MAFCTSCGKELSAGVKFCPDCGQRVNPPAPAPSAPVGAGYAPPPAPPPEGTDSDAPPAQQSYTPPVQKEYTSPAQQEYTPPAQQSYTPPVQQSYTPPPAARQKSSTPRAAKPRKPVSKKKLLIIGGAVLAVILAVVLIKALGGREPQGPVKYIGTWTCTGVSVFGIEMDTAGVLEGDFTLEILDTGRYKMAYDGSHHNSFWEADEENITVQSGTDKWTGTWRADGTIYFDDLFDVGAGMIFTKTAGGASEAEPSGDPLAGKWICTAYSYQGQQKADAATLFQTGCSVVFDGKKKCVIVVDDFEETVEWKQDGDAVVITGSHLFKDGFAFRDNALEGEYGETGVTLYFAKEGAAGAGAAVPGGASQTGAAVISQEQLDVFNGDWYGYLTFEDGSGALEELNGSVASTFVRISLSPDGTGVFYAMPYIDGGETLFELTPVVDGDELALTGTFWGESIDEWDWTFYESYDGMYRIIGGYMQDDGMMDVNLRVRRWGEYWSEMDGDPFVSPEEVDWYASYAPEGLVAFFGADPANLPPKAGAAVEPGSPAGPEDTSVITDGIAAEYEVSSYIIKAMLPKSGWCSTQNGYGAVFYQLPALPERTQGNPRIMVNVRNAVENFDFYLADYENVYSIGTRTIAGIEMQGRTYANDGEQFIEYVGMAAHQAISVKCTGIDLDSGEGLAVLNGITARYKYE